ncbi:MAG: DUF2490 domain-containing protein [Pontixanthobacter sp.]
MTRLIKTLTLPFLMTMPASTALAEEDAQLWIDTVVSYPIADDTRFALQTQPRISLDGERTDQLFLRAGVSHRATKDATIGGGLILLGEFGPVEKRPYASVDFGSGPLTLRTMAEFRFFDGADRMAIRLRQRAQMALPIAARTDFVTSGEVFYTARSQSDDGDTRVSQWRAIAGIRYAASDKLNVSAGYLALGIPRPDAEDSLSHIPTIGASYAF